MFRKSLKYIIIGVIAVLVSYLWSKYEKQAPQPVYRDYADIIREGILHVATEYNTTGYFINNDTLAGFHYDLIRLFAEDKGLQANIVPEMSFEKRMEGLKSGKYDIIASDMVVNSELKESVLLTDPLILSKLVLVQRKADRYDPSYIYSQVDLAGKTLHVVKGSPAILRIQNLENEIGDTIYIREVEKYGSEQLISMVAHADIDYVVCEENIAKAVIDSLPSLDISTKIGFTQFYSWAVNKNSPALLDTLNSWIAKMKNGEDFIRIQQKHLP